MIFAEFLSAVFSKIDRDIIFLGVHLGLSRTISSQPCDQQGTLAGCLYVAVDAG